MKVLVTGSSGYLASVALPRVAANPGVEELVGLDVRPPRSPQPRLRHIAGSVLDPGLVDLLERERPAVVLHLAWVFNPTHDRAEMERICVGGTKALLAACRRVGVPHVIYLSSTTAYGAHPDNPERLRESDPPRGNRDFPYSADKATVERFLDEFESTSGAPVVTRLRPCIVLGRRADNFVRAILDLPVLPRLGSHDPALQFLHEDDLARGLELALEKRPPGAFNLAPDATVTVSEIGRLLGHPTPSIPGFLLRPAIEGLWRLRLLGVPASYLDFVVWPWVADTARARDVLGFEATRTSREAVLETRRG